jgi:MFS transporter, ACS family, D-galactonate transporter
VGWRWAFILFAALGIAAALGYGVFARERPRIATAEPIRIADALALLRHKVLWVCSAIQFVRFSVITAYNLWLPSLLMTDRSFSLASTGLVLAMSAAFAAPSNALGGYVSDRLRNPPLVIGASLAILACTSVLLVQVESTVALLLVIATSSVFAPLFFGPLFFVPIEVLGQRTAGTVIGFANLFANIGGVITAYTLGAVKDANGSFSAGFIGIGVLCAIGVALSAVLARVRTRALTARERIATRPARPGRTAVHET